MNTSRLVLSGLLGSAGAAVLVMTLSPLVACGGGDDSSTGTNSGDAAVDSSVGDSGGDASSAKDATSNIDGSDASVSVSDGGAPPEASGSTEGGTEASAQLDSGGDAFVCSITVPALADFETTLTTEVCQRFQSCCGISTSDFDMVQCQATFAPARGGWLGTGFFSPYIDAGAIAYDTNSACQCLVGSANFNCSTITEQYLGDLQSTCAAAVHGGLSLDAPCTTQNECTPNAFCALGDAGTGRCAALQPDGGNCTGNAMCTYGATGAPLLYCDSTSSTCVPRLGVDAGCTVNQMCASNSCLASVCSGGGVATDPGGGLCAFFTIHDAGQD